MILLRNVYIVVTKLCTKKLPVPITSRVPQHKNNEIDNCNIKLIA